MKGSNSMQPLISLRLYGRIEPYSPGNIEGLGWTLSKGKSDTHVIELTPDDLARVMRPIAVDISSELFDFAQQIARMTTAEEMDDASEMYGADEGCMSGDDACATISDLIEIARELVAKVESL